MLCQSFIIVSFQFCQLSLNVTALGLGKFCLPDMSGSLNTLARIRNNYLYCKSSLFLSLVFCIAQNVFNIKYLFFGTPRTWSLLHIMICMHLGCLLIIILSKFKIYLFIYLKSRERRLILYEKMPTDRKKSSQGTIVSDHCLDY